jgi:ABC-type hemin transport system substrate-binding protein
MMHRRDFMADSARAIAALAGAGFGAAALGACKREPTAQQPSGTTPALPQSSAQPSGALRIAAVSPALAITLRDLGLADKIIARHAWDMVLDLKVPIVGDQASLDYEALLDAKPTHVLLEWGARPVPDRMTSLAAEHNWRVKSWSLLSYDQLRASFNEIATFIAQGQPASEGLALAARAAELTTRFDNACAQRPAASRAGTVLLLHSVSPIAALGPGSFHHDILSRLGATARAHQRQRLHPDAHGRPCPHRARKHRDRRAA